MEVLLKAKDYSKLIPKKGFDKNGKPRIDWIDPNKDRDQAPDRRGQQTMFDMDAMEQEHSGRGRGYFDDVKEGYDDHVVKPLVDHFSKVEPGLASRIQTKYQNYIFDQETKEIDLEIDYDTARYMMLMKEAPGQGDSYVNEHIEATSGLKKMVNGRKKHMAGKMVDLSKGSELPLTGGRTGTMEGFTKNGFPIVRIGQESVNIFWEEIRYHQ